MKTRHGAIALAALGTLVACALAYRVCKLFLGVDFFDEAYTMSFLWRFAGGDRMYYDEKSFHQNFAVFVMPAVWLFRYFVGKSDGLVLYYRCFSLLLTIGGAIGVYAFFRPRYERTLAAAFAASFLLFHGGTSTFGYGPVCVFAFLLGGLAFFRAVEASSLGWALTAGLAHAVTLSIDPTQVVPCAALLGAGLYFTAGQRRLWVGYGSPIALLAIVLSAYAGREGISNMLESLQFQGHGNFSVDPLTHLRDLFATIPYRPYYVAVLALCGYAYVARKQRLLQALTACAPLLALFTVWSIGYGPKWYLTYFGLAGLFLYAANRDRATEARLMWLLWFPSVWSSILLTWSGNLGGVARFGNGMGLAFLATLCFLWSVSRSRVPVFLAVGSLTLLAWTELRRSHEFHQTQVRVSSGPYQGLWTDSYKEDLLRRLSAEIRKVESANGRILFHPHFPAGYLLTNMLPAMNNVWWTVNEHPRSAPLYLQDYRRYESGPLVAVIVKVLPYIDTINPVLLPTQYDLLEPHIQATHRLVHSEPQFEIYVWPAH